MSTKPPTYKFQVQSEKDYDRFRPTYSPALYETVLKFHNKGNVSSSKVAVDVGSGTGHATVELAKTFDKVYGVEPSEKMRNAAKLASNVEYVNGDAYTIPLPDQSVDLVTVAQAAHWFDIPTFTKETQRVLRPGGTLAIWGYGISYVRGNKEASSLLHDYSTKFMHDYWDSRRFILDDLYRSIDVNSFGVVERHIIPNPFCDALISREMEIEFLRGYMRTWSCYATYKKKHPDLPDPVDEMIIPALENVLGKSNAFMLEHPMSLIMCKHFPIDSAY
ncbi:S-adenosyl-L-methionine-dependent methyltransferase [Cladochytrium replicatum]|nr:S-adenosyl-L-methionine-dependent methyltransferase [Cladochytrium replicatum]